MSMKNLPFAIVQGQPGQYSLAAHGVVLGPVGTAGEHLVRFGGAKYSFCRVVDPAHMGDMLIFQTHGEFDAFLKAEIFKDAPSNNQQQVPPDEAPTEADAPAANDAVPAETEAEPA